MVYQHRGLDNISINSLEEKCEEFNKRKTLYLPISINKNKLEECLHQDMTPIEFVLRCSGYSKRSTRQKFPSTGGTGGMDFCTEDYYDGSKSGDYYFQSIKEVYYFLKGMRIV